jgi:hypothetical protein
MHKRIGPSAGSSCGVNVRKTIATRCQHAHKRAAIASALSAIFPPTAAAVQASELFTLASVDAGSLTFAVGGGVALAGLAGLLVATDPQKRFAYRNTAQGSVCSCCNTPTHAQAIRADGRDRGLGGRGGEMACMHLNGPSAYERFFYRS